MIFDGGYDSGDILEQTINRSLTEPSCTTGWKRYQRDWNRALVEVVEGRIGACDILPK